MEYTQFVRWWINQYLIEVNSLKDNIYRKSMNYIPMLLDIPFAARCIFLTAVFNEIPELILDRKRCLEKIQDSLKKSYEKISGNWKKTEKECIAVTECYVKDQWVIDRFFILLPIIADDLYYSGDQEGYRTLVNYMVDIPAQYECLSPVWNRKGEPTKGAEELEKFFLQMIKKETSILHNCNDGVTYIDYMGIQNFFKRYWYQMQYETSEKCRTY